MNRANPLLFLLPALVAVSLASALATACVAASGAPTTANSAEAQFLALIGVAGCDSDSQCRTIAIGAKACGGPQAYRAWSTRQTDEATLRAVAEAYAARMRVEVSKSGTVSNCAMVTDPGAQCAASVPNDLAAGAEFRSVCRLRGAPQGIPGAAD